MKTRYDLVDKLPYVPGVPDTPLTREQTKNREMYLGGYDYMSPRISTEVPDCGFPMTVDAYSLCAYDCSYCFASMIKISHNMAGKDFNARKVRAIDLAKLERMLSGKPNNNLYEQELYNGFIRYKIPFHWGGLTDPFDRYEQQLGVGLSMLALLKQYNYPTFICFKGDALMHPEYQMVIQDATNFVFQMSIAGLDDHMGRLIDKGAPAISRRLEIMRMLSEMGKRVYWRFRPFVLGWSDLHMDELFDKVNEACLGKCEAVSIEWMALSGMADANLKALYDDMSKHLGYDVQEYWRRMSRSTDSYRRCNEEVKRPHFLKAWGLARQYGMSFAVSDPHFKELNDSCNCCGVPKTDPILGSYTIGQQTEAILIAKRKGWVAWGDMAQAMDWAANFKKVGDHINFGSGRAHNKHKAMSVKDWLHMLWNSPENADSPYRYFWGKLLPQKDLDVNGDIVYDYVRSDYENEDPRFTDTKETHRNCKSCGACGYANTAYEGKIGKAQEVAGPVIDIEPTEPPVPTHRTRMEDEKRLARENLGVGVG